jgi:cytochrome c5
MAERLVFPTTSLIALALLACGPQQPAQRADAKAGGDSAQAASTANDKLLLAALRVALPPPGVTAQDLPDPHAAGAGDLAQFCTRCHNLPAPTIHSATDWPSVVRRMWLRMDRLSPEFGVPVPTAEQRQTMLNYLIENALKVSGAELPQGPGRPTFSQVCSRCHSLPDPRQHSPDDWPAVVMRMETRMQQMQVNRPPQAQVQEILAYLQQASKGARKR